MGNVRVWNQVLQLVSYLVKPTVTNLSTYKKQAGIKLLNQTRPLPGWQPCSPGQQTLYLEYLASAFHEKLGMGHFFKASHF
jgi:hypothetical protein